ncbi:MAG: redox-active protein [Opitutae bacterium]|nr:redox-active protein [Opitutae bacterium]
MSEKTENAVKIFHAAPDFYNCAQAVAASCGRADLLDKMKLCGGGRAPSGLCGALYAATQVLPPEKCAEARAAFVAANGAETCVKLKKNPNIKCADRVASAVAIVEKISQAGK